MTEPIEKAKASSSWVSLVERLIVVAVSLPACHLTWTSMLSSWVVREATLPRFHQMFAEWIIRPRVLLILTAVFVVGFVGALCARNRDRMWLAILRILSTLVTVLALALSSIAFSSLLFPIYWRAPEL